MSNPKPNPLFAACLILIAGGFIAGTTALAKLLGGDQLGQPLHPFMVTFGRFLFAFAAVLCALRIMRPKIINPHFTKHALRSFCGLLGVTGMFAAAKMIPLGDATAISFLNPVFAMLFAIPILGEKVGRYRWLAAIMALGGGFVLLRPSADSLELGGLVAFGAAMILGFELILIKQLSRGEGVLQILFLNNAFGLAFISVLASFVWITPNPAQWGALAAIGFLMIAAQSCYVNALKRADASFIAPFSYVTLIFALFYDNLFFGVWPDAITFLGAFPIILGAVILAWREGLAHKKRS